MLCDIKFSEIKEGETVIYTDTQTCKMQAELSKNTFQTQN